jgi:hypothetical protein
MIEIFKTNVQNKTQARRVMELLTGMFTGVRVNVDLHDCDRILRVEGMEKSGPEQVIQGVNRLGFICEILE